MKRGRSRSRNAGMKLPGTINKRTKKDEEVDDDEFSFGSESSDGEDGQQLNDDEFFEETSDERRLRLAKEHLDTLTGFTGADGEDDDDGIVDEGKETEDMDPIALRLHREAQKLKGKLKRKVAENIREKKQEDFSIKIMRGHRKPVTCVCLSADDTVAYTGSKDGSIIKWDIVNHKKLYTIKRVVPQIETKKKKSKKRRSIFNTGNAMGHTRAVFCVAVSTDGKLLASGGEDPYLMVWDTESFELKYRLSGHRDAITCVAFRENTYTCFSGSTDRTVRVWDLATGAYVESLYGHQSDILSMDSLLLERAITSGYDKSCRLWKIPEQTQLVFKTGAKAALDCVRYVDDGRWVTACQDGSVALWSLKKKKPIAKRDRAHAGRWVTSVASRIFTDLIASGSSDGYLKLWQITDDTKLSSVHQIPVVGYINGICFSRNGRFLVLGVAQEHRMGRWERIREARNGIHIVYLDRQSEGHS